MDTPILKRHLNSAVIVIIVCIVYCSIILDHDINKYHKPIQYELSWKDNINNPNNIEYVNELKFNTTTKDLQIEFCYRYWNSLDDNSKEWFKQQLK